MELDILDPGAGLGEAIVEMADVAHPIAERAAIRIELPGPDDNHLDGMAGETRAEQQDRPVLRRRKDRLPSGGSGAKFLDFGRRPPANVAVEHHGLVVARTVRACRQLAGRQTLGTEFVNDIGHRSTASLPGSWARTSPRTTTATRATAPKACPVPAGPSWRDRPSRYDPDGRARAGACGRRGSPPRRRPSPGPALRELRGATGRARRRHGPCDGRR